MAKSSQQSGVDTGHAARVRVTAGSGNSMATAPQAHLPHRQACTMDVPGEVGYADLSLPNHSCWLTRLASWRHPEVINEKPTKSRKTSGSNADDKAQAASLVPPRYPTHSHGSPLRKAASSHSHLAAASPAYRHCHARAGRRLS